MSEQDKNQLENNDNIKDNKKDDILGDMVYKYKDAIEDLPTADFSKYLEEEPVEEIAFNKYEEAEEPKEEIQETEKIEEETTSENTLENNAKIEDLTKSLDKYFSEDIPQKEKVEVSPQGSAPINKGNATNLQKKKPVKFSPKVPEKKSAAEKDKKQAVQKGELKKPLSTGQLIYRIIMVVCIFVMVCAGSYLGYEGVNYLKERKALNKLSESREVSGTDEDFLKLKEQYPDVDFPDGIIPSLWLPYAQNQDVIGWIKIAGTKVDNPVVQTSDDDISNTYLKANLEKKYAKEGTLFLSRSSGINPFSRNLVIYGHHMKDGRMFGTLKKYRTIDGFKESPLVEFDTLFEEIDWKVYAVFLTNSLEKDDNGYTFNYVLTDFANENKFAEFIGQIDQRKLYTTGVDINKNDTILTLSTCEYDFNEARLVVVARKVRAGESSDVDVNLATEKAESDIRYPQAWYDKKGKTNPFAGAAQWTP